MKKMILALALVFTGSTQAATITNGSFEAGLFGWSTAGNVGLSFANATDGVFSAFLDPDNGAVSVGAIEAALGLGAGTIDGLTPGGPATNGQALYQSIGNVAAGEFISFEYTFNDTESNGATFNDSAVALLDGDTGSLIDAVLGVGADSSGSATLLSDGIQNATLAFIAFNQVDGVVSPQLWIDNVDATIPVPATLFLLGAGLLALGLAKRKKA